RTGPGFRYFLWKLGYVLVTFAGMVALIGIPAAIAFSAGWFRSAKEHIAPLILAGLFVCFLVFVFAVAAAVVFVLTKDFVIPQMALEGIGAMEGWRRLWSLMGAEKTSYIGYLGMKILMALAAGVLIFIGSVILGFIVAVPAIWFGIIV